MKWIVTLFGFLTLLIVSLYALLFTSLGHGIILPIIEEKIQEASKVNNVKFTTFKLSTNSIDTTLMLDNNPIVFKGNFNIISSNLDFTYDIHIKNLNIFNAISNQKLQGEFQTKGSIQGNIENIFVKGVAFFAQGETNYALNLKEKDIVNLSFSLKNVAVEKLLWMVNQPIYATAKLNIEGEIKSINHLDGLIVTKVENGVLNSDYINKTFQQNLPTKSSFDATIQTTLQKENIISIVDFNSFIATIDTKKTIFNLPSGKLTTDYVLNIPRLNDLYFVTNQKLKGGIVVNGEVIFDKKLLATFKSNLFDGTMDGKLDDNKLLVKLNNIQSLKLLDMLYYPEIFKSNIQLTLDYDIATKQGISKLTANDGQFLTNQATQLLKQFTQYDLTMEIYNVTNLTTNINESLLKNELYMKSTNSEIKSKIFDIETQKSTINADLILQYRKYDMNLKVAGDIANPKVKLNAGKVLEEKAKEKVKEKLNEKLKEKMGSEVGNILDSFFK